MEWPPDPREIWTHQEWATHYWRVSKTLLPQVLRSLKWAAMYEALHLWRHSTDLLSGGFGLWGLVSSRLRGCISYKRAMSSNAGTQARPTPGVK